MTILNKTEIFEPSTIWLGISVFMYVVSAVTIIISIADSNGHLAIIATPIAVISCIAVVLISNSKILAVSTNRYQYECLIEHNTPFEDIADRYNIIEHRGDIWILEDKESE